MADRIELTGLECFGYHGVFEEEKRTGQPFIVDLTCWSEFADAAATDDLSKTINYAELADVAANIIEGPARDLIETVASEVADTIMDTMPWRSPCTSRRRRFRALFPTSPWSPAAPASTQGLSNACGAVHRIQFG